MSASSAVAGGVAVLAARARPGRRTSLAQEQILRRRNEDWLEDYEVGRVDPETGRRVPRSYSLIAAIYRVDESTVRKGIQAARELREARDDAII